MSIEKSLKSIADSLEILAGVADDKAVKSFAAEIPLPIEKEPAPVVVTAAETVAPTPAPKTAAPAVVPAPAPVEKATAPKAAAPKAAAPTPAVQMTLTELDAALLVEYNRLKQDRTLIDGIIKGYGVNTATELAPADYQAVLDAVKAL